MRYFDPLHDVEALRREIDRTFEEFWGSRAPRQWQVAFLPGRAARQYPLVNLSEDKDNFYVEALAPGVDPDSLDLAIDGDVLTISGAKKGPEGVPPEAFHRSERAAGRFSRRVELSLNVDVGKVKAEYRNGLLLITLPKAPEAKPRQIPITVR